MPKESYFDSDGIQLHYLDWGGAGPNITLLPGLGASAQCYRGLAPKLVDRFRVVALTSRGHGRSGRPNSGYNLDAFVDDIRRFLDALTIQRTVLIGHSFAGLEMPRFAVRYPERVAAIVFLDALFPRIDPEPDFSDDPTWPLISTSGPTAADLASRQAYIAYCKRANPEWAIIWCEAIEADMMDRVSINSDGTLDYHHDDELMNQIYQECWLSRDPEFTEIEVPMLAIVPDGDYHQLVPLNATDELRQAADQYWLAKNRPWLRQRTAIFRQQAPSAHVVELDSPYHYIFIAEEKETVSAIRNFLPAA